MNAHITLFEAKIGDEGLQLEVWEHCDRRGEFIVSIERHGMNEMTTNSATELRLLGESLRLAGIRAQEAAQNPPARITRF